MTATMKKKEEKDVFAEIIAARLWAVEIGRRTAVTV